MAITISVKLFASLAKYKPIDIQTPICKVELNEGATVEGLVSVLNIPKDKISTISLNDKFVKIDARLNDSDVLLLFPTIAGG